MKLSEYDKVIVTYKMYILDFFYIGDPRSGIFVTSPLSRALMGSGELRVLMGGGPKAPLRIFKSKNRRVKIHTALERSRRTLQDTIMLSLFLDL